MESFENDGIKENLSPPIPEEPKKKSKKDDDDTIYTSYIDNDLYILEEVKSATHATHATHAADTQFACFNKASREVTYLNEFKYDGKVYKPIVSKLLDENGILLPSEAKDYGEVGDLVQELKDFFNKYFEAPEFSQNLFPYLVLFYWVYDKFPFIPYIHFMGRTGTGKSTAMEVVGSVCYKPIDASGAITLASIFRIVNEWKGTLLIDEFNPGGEGYQEMLSLLKSGVSDRLVLRVEGERKRKVEAYVVKSPKLFTSEKPINDAGLRSRVIEVKMERNKNQVPLFRRKGFLVKAQDLRNKLLMWRFNKLDGIEDALDKLEFGFKELQSFDGRTQQVITPIYYMADAKARAAILSLAKEQEEETLRERRESIDGQIFQYIADNWKEDGSTNITITDIFKNLTEGDKNKRLTERKIGSIVRKMHGFEIKRSGHDNQNTIIFEKKEDKLNELSEYYGLKVVFAECVACVACVAEENDRPREQEAYNENDIKNIFDL